ncbi:hypothetical protein D3C81_1329400 [compost metagenome]
MLGSATVGPEAIALGSSPATSETISVVTGAWLACASRPPWMRETCLRTMFMSVIGAPQRSNSLVVAFRSAIGMPSAGSDSRLEPPPETSTSSRSCGVSDCTAARISAAACSPDSSGTGWPASITRIWSVGMPCA